MVEGTAIYRGDWHVTLAFIGDFPERQIPHLLDAVRVIPFEPVRLRFDRAEFWPRPKVAVLAAQAVPAALEKLVNSLNLLLTDSGVLPAPYNFRPHITIVKRARPFEKQQLAQPAVIEWSGFELVESAPAQGGRTYRPLKQ